MSDVFWIQLFTFLGVTVTAIVPVILMLVRMNTRISRGVEEQRIASVQDAIDRQEVLRKVDKVEDKIASTAVETKALAERSDEFMSVMVKTDVFEAAKIKRDTERRASGFGDIAP